jgi:hypothetical protein
MPCALRLSQSFISRWLRESNKTVAAGFSLRGKGAPVKGAATTGPVLLAALSRNDSVDAELPLHPRQTPEEPEAEDFEAEAGEPHDRFGVEIRAIPQDVG